MINPTHLEMVSVYLSQELPPPYNTYILVEHNDMFISLPNDNKNIFVIFDYLYRIIVDSLSSIANLQEVITIVLKTENNSRSFQIKINSADGEIFN